MFGLQARGAAASWVVGRRAWTRSSTTTAPPSRRSSTHLLDADALKRLLVVIAQGVDVAQIFPAGGQRTWRRSHPRRRRRRSYPTYTRVAGLLTREARGGLEAGLARSTLHRPPSVRRNAAYPRPLVALYTPDALQTNIIFGGDRFKVFGGWPAARKAMASKQTAPIMNQGQGETSYAHNSSIQNAEQNKMKSLIEAVIVELCSNTGTLQPGKMVIADLGCSTGPNALALVSIAVEAIHAHCLKFQQPSPEVSVLLNDLPENDFNTVVKSLVMLRQSNDPVVVTGITPGSFYERLFTSESVHLVCSSNSLHWLSKAPEDLKRNLIPAYDIDEHSRRERLPIVLEAYAKQYRRDFTLFLELRAKELASGGRMIISLLGRRSDIIATKFPFLPEIVAQILCVMVSEGVIDKEKFDSFYGLMHEPSLEELREIIQEEGSFSIREMREHDPRTDINKTLSTPGIFAGFLRSLFEPVIVQHFGYVMDEFVRTVERRYILEGSLQEERAKCPYAMLVVSLAKA